MEAEQPDHRADDHRVRHAVVGEPGHEVGLHHAELDAEVRLVHAERDGGGGGQPVPDDDHRQRHGVVLEVHQVVHAEVRQGDRLEEHHVALEHAEVHALAHVVRRDVHAVVREGGGAHEETRVDELPGDEQHRRAHHVVQAGVHLQLAHALGGEDDVPRHELPHQPAGLDGGEEQVARGGVVPRRERALHLARPAEALRVDHVVELAGDSAVDVLGGQVGDDVDLAVVVEAHGVAVRKAPAAALHGEVRLHLLVLVHREHHAVDVAEGVDGPRPVAVLRVEDGVGVVVVVRRRHVDLVHRGNRLDVVAVGAETLREHAHHLGALHDVRERLLDVAVQALVPPVRGAVARGVLLGHEVNHRLQRRLVLLVAQLAPHHVVVRDDPGRERLLHVHERVDAQGEQEVGVLQEQHGPARGLELVRALEGLLAGDDVRELLADVPDRHELERVRGGEGGREDLGDRHQAGHPRGGGDPQPDVLQRHEQGDDVRADERLVRVLHVDGLAEHHQRGDDAHGGGDHVQGHVQGVGVVRAEAHREIRVGGHRAADGRDGDTPFDAVRRILRTKEEASRDTRRCSMPSRG